MQFAIAVIIMEHDESNPRGTSFQVIAKQCTHFLLAVPIHAVRLNSPYLDLTKNLLKQVILDALRSFRFLSASGLLGLLIFVYSVFCNTTVIEITKKKNEKPTESNYLGW